MFEQTSKLGQILMNNIEYSYSILFSIVHFTKFRNTNVNWNVFIRICRMNSSLLFDSDSNQRYTYTYVKVYKIINIIMCAHLSHYCKILPLPLLRGSFLTSFYEIILFSNITIFIYNYDFVLKIVLRY